MPHFSLPGIAPWPACSPSYTVYPGVSRAQPASTTGVSESGTRSASPPRGARETQGFSRPGYCPQPHPQAGYTQEQKLGYQAGWTSRRSSPGLGGAKVTFPRTSRGGCFACQSPPPAVQTVFAERILASAVHLS